MDNYLKNKINGIKNSDTLLFNKLRQFHNLYEKLPSNPSEKSATQNKNDELTNLSNKYFPNIQLSEKSSPNMYSYIRFLKLKKEAVFNQTGKLKELFPKSLIYIGVLAIPSLLLYILGFYRISYSPSAGRAIQIIALIMPMIFFGPIHMGYLSGILNVTRTGQFSKNPFTNTLFFAFNDKYFIKSILTFLIIFSAVLSPLLPAVILTSFSNNLFFNVVDTGFAYTATKIICIFLWTAGLSASIYIWLRLSITFAIIIDNIDIKPINAVKFSFKTMKNNCLTLFMLMISYIGWYIIALGFSLLIILIIGAAIYIYIQSIIDPATSYMYLIYSILLIYILSCIIFTLAISAIISRPTIGLVTFYNNLLAGKTDKTSNIDENSDITNITDISEISNLPDLS